MHIVRLKLTGQSQYSQSRPHDEPKLNKEGPDAYEARTWPHRMHINDDGYVVFPPMALKNCLSEVAKFISEQIPSKGKSTYTKHFEAGILPTGEIPLIIGANGKPIHKDDWQAEGTQLYADRIYTPSDGVAGSGKRVWRTYPVIKEGWTTEISMIIVDDTITEPVFERHIKQAGLLIGIGRWRVRNRGMYGRFSPEILEWKELE